MNDSDLNGLFQEAYKGNQAAKNELLTQIWPVVLRYCRGRLGVGDHYGVNAEDIAQEVMLAVSTALPRYKDMGNPFMAFVYGIASHKISDSIRSMKRNKSTAYGDMPIVQSQDYQPDIEVLAADSLTHTEDVLKILSEKQREIVVLRLIMGYSAEETAQITKTTPGAVRVAQHRALQRLREELGQEHSSSSLCENNDSLITEKEEGRK